MKIIAFVLFVVCFLYSMFNLYQTRKVTKKLEYKIEHAKTLNDFENILYEED